MWMLREILEKLGEFLVKLYSGEAVPWTYYMGHVPAKPLQAALWIQMYWLAQKKTVDRK
jgi:hypothetical protein